MTLAWPIIRRFLPHLAVIAAVLAALLWFDARGYDRAETAARAREARQLAATRDAVAGLERRMGERMARIDRETTARLTTLSNHQRRTVAALEQELARDPIVSDPHARLGDGSLRALNDSLAGPRPATGTGAAGQPTRAVPRTGAGSGRPRGDTRAPGR